MSYADRTRLRDFFFAKILRLHLLLPERKNDIKKSQRTRRRLLTIYSTIWTGRETTNRFHRNEKSDDDDDDENDDDDDDDDEICESLMDLFM